MSLSALPSSYVTVALPANIPSHVTIPRGRGVFVVSDADVPGYVLIVVMDSRGTLRDAALIARDAYHRDTLHAFAAWLDAIDPVARPSYVRAVG